VLERPLIVRFAVAIGAELELQVGFIGEIVRARRRHGQTRECEHEQGANEPSK
jgi:hypothetical protein